MKLSFDQDMQGVTSRLHNERQRLAALNKVFRWAYLKTVDNNLSFSDIKKIFPYILR